MTRDPARDAYDAVVDLYPPERPSEVAYALVKFTYDVSTGTCRLMDPDPLLHDIRQPDAEYPLMPGSDFRFFKAATDVVVLGSAYPPDGRPAHTMQVQVAVGERRCRIRVIGFRLLEEGRNGRPRLGTPEPFTEMPVRWEYAYGGADLRVPVDEPTTVEEAIRQSYDHPGVYPRNPFGKGYVVLPELVEGIELPNLEDPDRPLTDENIFVRDPRRWYEQPLPTALNWVQPLMFPRFVYLGVDAWFPGPQDERLPEVARGFVQRDYRRRQIENRSDFAPTLPFFQEANPALVFGSLEPGTPVSIDGMRPDGRTVSFTVPHPPYLEIALEGRRVPTPARLINVLIEPERFQAAFTYSASTSDLPRKFVPGVHGHIPLSVTVEGDSPVPYEAPTPAREKLDRAEAGEEESPGAESASGGAEASGGTGTGTGAG